jgi:hypothetical protein
MKIIFLLLIFLSVLNLKAQGIKFRLYHCESTKLIQIYKDSLFFESSLLDSMKYKTVINEKDLKILKRQFLKISQKRADEIWLNNCIDGGINLKFIICKDTLLKKVFVGNYYDKRLNKIVLIINKYVKGVKSYFWYKGEKISTITTIPYTLNKNEAKEYYKIQKNCDEAPLKYKNYLLNEWCELNK